MSVTTPHRPSASLAPPAPVPERKPAGAWIAATIILLGFSAGSFAILVSSGAKTLRGTELAARPAAPEQAESRPTLASSTQWPRAASVAVLAQDVGPAVPASQTTEGAPTASGTETWAVQTPEEMKAHVEALYFQEAVDRAWSRSAEPALSRGVEKSLPPGSRVVAVECKATLCRATLTHESSDQAALFVRNLASDRPWNGPMHMTGTEADPNGRLSNALYIAREGHPIDGVAL